MNMVCSCEDFVSSANTNAVNAIFNQKLGSARWPIGALGRAKFGSERTKLESERAPIGAFMARAATVIPEGFDGTWVEEATVLPEECDGTWVEEATVLPEQCDGMLEEATVFPEECAVEETVFPEDWGDTCLEEATTVQPESAYEETELPEDDDDDDGDSYVQNVPAKKARRF